MNLWCCLCLHTREDPSEAETIINGQAVCMDHAGYVQGGIFTQALILVKKEESGVRS